MGIEKSTPIAMILPNQQEVAAFTIALAECGFRKIVAFTSTKEAYEVAVRQQFQLFVTRMDMPIWNGIIFIQKLRETGNYGMENHLFVCSKLDQGLTNTLYELDLPYVLVAPFNRQAIKDKFQHMLKTEGSLSSLELKYREAKSAYFNKLDDMALDIVDQVLAEKPEMEQALMLKGSIELDKKNLDQAQAIFSNVLKIYPKSAAALHKLAQIKMARNEFKAAADILNRLAEVNSYNIDLLQNAGLSCFNSDQLDLAKKHMGKVIAMDSTNKVAANVVAEVQVKQKDYDGIIATLKQTHNDKDMVSFLNNAGIKLSKGDDVPGAINMYTTALQHLTDSKYLYAVHYNLGIAYKKISDRESAVKHLRIAIQQKPDFDKAIASLKELEQKAA